MTCGELILPQWSRKKTMIGVCSHQRKTHEIQYTVFAKDWIINTIPLWEKKVKKILPERDVNTEESVHCNSHETQNWDQGQCYDHAALEETTVEWSLHVSIHHHSKWYGHTANHEVRHSQRDNEAEGRLFDTFTGPQCQNHHHITKTAANSDNNLQ